MSRIAPLLTLTAALLTAGASAEIYPLHDKASWHYVGSAFRQLVERRMQYGMRDQGRTLTRAELAVFGVTGDNFDWDLYGKRCYTSKNPTAVGRGFIYGIGKAGLVGLAPLTEGMGKPGSGQGVLNVAFTDYSDNTTCYWRDEQGRQNWARFRLSADYRHHTVTAWIQYLSVHDFTTSFFGGSPWLQNIEPAVMHMDEEGARIVSVKGEIF